MMKAFTASLSQICLFSMEREPHGQSWDSEKEISAYWITTLTTQWMLQVVWRFSTTPE